MGLCISLNATMEVFNIDTYIPACPLVHVLSSSGILKISSIIYDLQMPYSLVAEETLDMLENSYDAVRELVSRSTPAPPPSNTIKNTST